MSESFEKFPGKTVAEIKGELNQLFVDRQKLMVEIGGLITDLQLKDLNQQQTRRLKEFCDRRDSARMLWLQIKEANASQSFEAYKNALTLLEELRTDIEFYIQKKSL